MPKLTKVDSECPETVTLKEQEPDPELNQEDLLHQAEDNSSLKRLINGL